MNELANDYMTTEEVMEVLHVTRKTVYNMVADGRIRRAKVGKRNLYRREDVRAIIEQAFDNE